MTDDPETEPKEEKKLQLATTIEEAGPCRLKIRIEVSAESVAEKIEEEYRKLGESAELPGFRKGRAPRPLLERKFGKALLEDVKTDLIQQSFEEVREERKLEPLSLPEVDPEKIPLETGKPFAWETTIEVRPSLDIRNYVGLKVRKPRVSVEESEVDALLREFQELKSEWVPAEDQTARPHDQVIADLDLTSEGKTVNRIENQAVLLNEHLSLHGLKLPELYKNFVGRRPGETVEVPVSFPADFADPALAGKPTVLRAQIKGVKRKRVPAIDDQFAKTAFDLDSVNELRAHLRRRIEREKEEEIRRKMAEDLVEELIRTNDFPLPEGLLETASEEMLRRVHLELALKGVPEEVLQKDLEKQRGASRDVIRKVLKTRFLLEHIADRERIFVLEEEVEAKIAELAAGAGRWPHEMRAYLEEQGLLRQLRRSMREDRVRDFLLSKAVIEEEGAGETGDPRPPA